MSAARPPEGARTAVREHEGIHEAAARPPEGARTAVREHEGIHEAAARPPEGARTESTWPLLALRDMQAPFAWRDGQPISASRFLRDAARQAERLPARGAMVNLCADRYAFAVSFAAAMMRGHASLLPPDALPHTLARLGAGSGHPVPASSAGKAQAGDASAGEAGNRGHHHAMPSPRWANSESPALYGLTDAESLDAAGMPLLRHEAASLSFEPHASEGLSERLAEVPVIESGRVAAVLLTSGSTGAPTPHAKTFGELSLNIRGAARRLAGLLGRDTLQGLNIVATVPPQHSYGLESSVLLAMLGGAAIDSGRPYYPADVAAALVRLPRPRALVTTPFHLKALLGSHLDLPAIDLVLSATAPLSPQLAAEAERRCGGPLIEIYGCTEAGQVATRRPVTSPVWHTFDDLRIWRDATGHDLQAEDATGTGADDRAAAEPSAGHYLVQGGHVLEPTVLADVLDLDDAQHFRLLGRAGDLVHVAGRRSSLAHLEHHLNSIAGVVDGAFWLPADIVDGVVRPVAFVVAPTLSAADIVKALRLRIEAVFVPRRIVHLAALPREATGKLTRRALGELAAAHASSGRASASA